MNVAIPRFEKAHTKGLPCKGERLKTDQVQVFRNPSDHFDVDFYCPELIFSLQLGVRDYSIAINSDKYVRRQLPAGSITLTPKGCSVRAKTETWTTEFLAFSMSNEFVENALVDTPFTLETLPVAPDVNHPEFLMYADLIRRYQIDQNGRSPI